MKQTSSPKKQFLYSFSQKSILMLVNFLKNVCFGIFSILFNDWKNFQNSFPRFHILPFLILRIVPLLLLLKFFYRGFSEFYGSFAHSRHGQNLRNISSSVFNSNTAFFVLLFFAFFIRLFFAVEASFILGEGDAMTRLETAKLWAQDTSGIPGGLIWLPMHFWLLSLPILLGCDPYSGAVIITSLLGTLTLIPLYKLTRLLWDKQTALLSCFMLAINPFHIKYSILTMSEVPFLFFALTSLTFLYYYLHKKSSNLYLILSSLSIMFCSLLRFEGWIISAILPLTLFYYKMNPKKTLLLTTLNFTPIVMYIISSLQETGTWIYGLSMSDKEVYFAYADRGLDLGYVFQMLSSDPVWPFWIWPLLLLGIAVNLKNVKARSILFVSAALLLPVVWKVFHFSSEPFWRYFSTGLFLLSPILASTIPLIGKKSRSLMLFAVLTFFYLSISDLIGSYNFFKQQEARHSGFLRTTNWFGCQHAINSNVVFCTDGFDLSAFRMLLNITPSKVYSPHYPGLKKFSNYEQFTEAVFVREISNGKNKYVFYQKSTVVDSMVTNYQNLLRSKSSPIISPIYSNARLRVLYISHPSPNP